MSNNNLAADNILRLKPYHPGKPIEEVQRELGLMDIIKLASNENPLGPSPKALAAMQEAVTRVALYPEGAAPTLREAVSARFGVNPESLTFGNGSDELLHIICQTFIAPVVDEVIIAYPTFAMYEIYATLADAAIKMVPLKNYTYDLQAMADAVSPKTRLIFVANPNNPTGTLVTAKEVEKFLERLPKRVVVVFDEAYDDYVENPDKPRLLGLAQERPNTIVTRTFSKVYALAGLRVGFAVSRPELADLMNRVRSPFNVNLVAQAAAVASLADTEYIKRSVELNSSGKRQIYAALDSAKIGYVPSESNFVLVDVERDSREIFELLLKRGVIVRAGFNLGLPNHIRVTIGTTEQTTRFLHELTDIMRPA
jgi:histidinol-phosphate aminotransferase